MPFKFRISTLEANKNDYPRGKHYGNWAGLSDVERKLISDNIKWGVNVFGVIGTMVHWRWTFAESLSVPTIPSISESLSVNYAGSFPMSSSLSAPAIPSISEDVQLSSTVVDDCEAAFDEYVAAGVVSDTDAVDFKVGTACARLTMDASAAVGRLATNDFGPLDAREYNYVKFWIKSSITINTNELSFLLDDTAECVSPIKDLNIGALVANTWTEKTLALGDTSGLSAIRSFGFDQDVDKGAFVLRIDQVRLCKGV